MGSLASTSGLPQSEEFGDFVTLVLALAPKTLSRPQSR
jgi:hypothetical protein